MSQSEARNAAKMEAAFRRLHLLTLIELSARNARERMTLASQMAAEAQRPSIERPVNNQVIAGKIQSANGEALVAAERHMLASNNDCNNVVAAAMELGALLGMIEGNKPVEDHATALAVKEAELEAKHGKQRPSGLIVPGESGASA